MSRASTFVLASATLLVLSGCLERRASDELEVRIETRGDTTVVVSAGEPPVVRAGRPEVLLQGAFLENPGSIMKVGDHFVIADRREIHIVNPGSGTVRSVGTMGEGPGEFGSVGALGFAGDDRVAVHDSRRQRVLFFDLEGRFLEEPVAPVTPPLVNPLPGGDREHFLVSGDAAYWIRTGNVPVDRPLPAGLHRHPLGGQRADVLEEWDDRTFILLASGVLGSRELFPPTTRAAFSRDGRLAVGTGDGPCFTVRRLAPPPATSRTDSARPEAQPRPANGGPPDPPGDLHPNLLSELLEVCRDRPPVAAGPSLRNPDLRAIEDEDMRETLEGWIRDMDRPEHLPYYTSLLFAEEGDLWVRTPGEELSDVHPFVIGRIPGVEPEVERWEVFDGHGRLVRAVEVPYGFRVWVIGTEHIVEVMELDTGELALGEVRLP